MIRIRRVYGTAFQADRNRVDQVQEMFPASFPYVASYAEKIPDMLDHPFRYGYRTVLLLSEDAQSRVTGFSLFLHFPEIQSSFLDFLAAAPRIRGGGVGAALYEATREHLSQIGSRGLYLETLSDDAAYVKDPKELQENRNRLRFYERYGVFPIAGTEYDRPTVRLPAGLLLFDGLGRTEPLGRAEAQAAVRLIIKRKHGKSVTADYVERVVASFVDEPVRFRPARYLRKAEPLPVVRGRLAKAFALVANSDHEIHLVQQRGYVERPARVGAIMEGLRPLGLFEEVKTRHFGEKPIRAVHDGDFVNYLTAVCRRLTVKQPVYPYVFPIRRPERRPKDLAVRAGYYCVDTFTPLDRNAYSAARAAVDVALTAAEEILAGRRVAYALCRPPGHHAGKRSFGGFCYFNNAAIAAQQLSLHGRVAVLDIDYHHGNGTQEIFYGRPDVLTVSIHGAPSIAYPHFSGFVDEVGQGDGKGFNRNYPLPEGTDGKTYLQAFSKAIERIARYRPAVLVLSLGLDCLRGDPTGSFKVPPDVMKVIGTHLVQLNVPLLIVQEGGYSLSNLRRGPQILFAAIAETLQRKDSHALSGDVRRARSKQGP